LCNKKKGVRVSPSLINYSSGGLIYYYFRTII
jgi:hypothetical protein